jgi:hypothetical protein
MARFLHDAAACRQRGSVRHSAAMRGLTGSLAVLPLAEIVDLLSRRRMTGALSCERASRRSSSSCVRADGGARQARWPSRRDAAAHARSAAVRYVAACGRRAAR